MIRPRDIFHASEAAAAGIQAGQWFEDKVRGALATAKFAAFLGIVSLLLRWGTHDSTAGAVALLCLATVVGSLLAIVILRLLALRLVEQPINQEKR